MMHEVFLFERAGTIARIPMQRRDAVVDLSEYWTYRQRDAAQSAAPATRFAIANLVFKIAEDLELIREAVTFGISDGQLEDAMTAIEDLQLYTFEGADTAAPIVKTCFEQRRHAVLCELFNLLCGATERAYGLPEKHFARAR